MSAKINAEWHAAHRMPKNPSIHERVEWHIAHASVCSCRPIPASVLKAMRERAAGRAKDRGQ
jgi:hypothetical protein